MLLLPIARRLVTPPSVEPITLTQVKSHLRVRRTVDDEECESVWIPAARAVAQVLTGEKFITQTWEFTYPYFPGGAEMFRRSISAKAQNSIQIPVTPIQAAAIQYRDTSGVLRTFGTFSGSPAFSGVGASSRVMSETPDGTNDSDNLEFTLAHEPYDGSLQLFVGGVLLIENVGYTLDGADIMLLIPAMGQSMVAFYQTQGGAQTLPVDAEEYSVLYDEDCPRIILNLNQQWPDTAPVDNAVVITVVAGYGDSGSDVPAQYKWGMLLLCGHFSENREAVVVDESRVVAQEIPLGIRQFLAVPRAG